MKVLLLSSGTGEGHNSAAKAVMDALVEKGVECVFLDPISFQSENAKKKVSSIYNKIISKVPFVFGIIYFAGVLYDKTPLPSPVLKANSKYAGKLAEYIKNENFDAVVCPHLFAMQAMAVVRVDKGFYVPTYSIMTDHTTHPFHKDAKPLDVHFASNEKTAKYIVKRGFDEQKVIITGIPANPKFALSVSKNEAKNIVGISESKKVISVMTGGAGCGKILKLCKKFNKCLSEDFCVCIFPGKNEKLRQRLLSEYSDNPKFKILPFTNDVHLYLKASEVALSKPGGLSSTEIAAANVPLVHLKAIPGCESYNVRYFKSRGLSLYGKSIRRAVKYTVKLLENKELAARMLEAQRRFVPANAADLIANKIIEDMK